MKKILAQAALALATTNGRPHLNTNQTGANQ
jgi:hypothetical protein